MYFNRKNITQKLVSWKNSSYRKPLLLKGARQVGKTWLIKNFGETHFKHIAYFNFDEQPDLKQFFEQTKDVKRILQNLSLVHGGTIEPDTTLIIFDEIQECNHALNALKYFCENTPEYAIAGAGSLLGITLGKETSFPVGKIDFLDVYPLTFAEFLEGSDVSLSNYLESVSAIEPLPDIFYNALLEKFKMYFISGGMPEAARCLVTENNIELTEKHLKDILSAYMLDISKHALIKDFAKIGYVWNSMPSQLGRENKKFLYQTVKPGARAREYEDALTWLQQAGLLHRVNRCSKPSLPLSAYADLSAFKLYLNDVGLLRVLAKLNPMAFREDNRLFTEFKGALTENYVLQSLIQQFDLPSYWTSEGIAEVDFVIQHKDTIIPVEVKSDINVRSKSLTYYHQTYNPPLRVRFSLKNLSYTDGLLNIPLFMADYSKLLINMI